MSHFKRSAKTPALLLYVLLFLLSARSLHADKTSADNSITTPGPNLTTQTSNTSAAHTPDDTALSSPNASRTSHTHNQTHVSGTNNTVNITKSNETFISISPTQKTSYTTTLTTLTTLVSTTSESATERTTQGISEKEGSGGGLLAFLVIFFLFAIGILGVLLFRLYKKSRSYSFDLSSSPFNDQASDNTPLKTVEMETFHSKDTDDLPAIPSVVIDSADNQPASPVANGNVEDGPGDPAITLDNGSSKSDVIGTLPDPAPSDPLDPLDPLDPSDPSDPSECGSQTECLPEESTDVDTEQQPANENNNNITVSTKAPAGLVSRENNFSEINLN